jgi:hypothetical protein
MFYVVQMKVDRISEAKPVGSSLEPNLNLELVIGCMALLPSPYNLRKI